MRIHFEAAARAELASAAKWYELRNPDLGLELMAEVQLAVDAIAAHPKTWPRVPDYADVRRFVISRFPFSVVYYFPSDEEIVILAVAHGSRRANYWRARLEPAAKRRPRRRR